MRTRAVCWLLVSAACAEPPLGTPLPDRRPVPEGVVVNRAEGPQPGTPDIAVAPDSTAPDTVAVEADSATVPLESLFCMVGQLNGGELQIRALAAPALSRRADGLHADCLLRIEALDRWQAQPPGPSSGGQRDSLDLHIAAQMTEIRRDMADIRCWAKVAAGVPGSSLTACAVR